MDELRTLCMNGIIGALRELEDPEPAILEAIAVGETLRNCKHIIWEPFFRLYAMMSVEPEVFKILGKHIIDSTNKVGKAASIDKLMKEE